jgi:hypothetical protein
MALEPQEAFHIQSTDFADYTDYSRCAVEIAKMPGSIPRTLSSNLELAERLR